MNGAAVSIREHQQTAETLAHHAYTRFVMADAERTEAALDCGSALIEAKAAAKHGTWGATLKRVGVSKSTAARWMRLSREGFKCATVAHLGGLRAADEFRNAYYLFFVTPLHEVVDESPAIFARTLAKVADGAACTRAKAWGCLAGWVAEDFVVTTKGRERTFWEAWLQLCCFLGWQGGAS